MKLLDNNNVRNKVDAYADADTDDADANTTMLRASLSLSLSLSLCMMMLQPSFGEWVFVFVKSYYHWKNLRISAIETQD